MDGIRGRASGMPPISPEMASNLRKVGYPEATLSDFEYHRWNEVHAWCKSHFDDRYTWCGQQFFFAAEDDRLLFTLRWG